jgi:hypothetical protein
LPIAAAIAPPATFAYDAQRQAIIAYDGPGAASSSVGHDAAHMSAKHEKQNGTTAELQSLLINFSKFLAAESVTLDANAIRFSQSNVRSTLPDIVESMKANGWQGSPINVVRMPDGSLTAVDNTRLAAASLTNTPVQAVIGGFDEVFPAARAGGNLQGATWGEAVLNRIGGQKPGWLLQYPYGSPFTGVHPSTPGFSP